MYKRYVIENALRSTKKIQKINIFIILSDKLVQSGMSASKPGLPPPGPSGGRESLSRKHRQVIHIVLLFLAVQSQLENSRPLLSSWIYILVLKISDADPSRFFRIRIRIRPDR